MSVAGAAKKVALGAQDLANNKIVALATYRSLLRAINLAFQGDVPTHTAARSLARDSFIKERKLETGTLEAVNALEHAREVARILRENVVQGTKTADETYKLNIHEHTQRLDNGTTKELKGTTKSFKEIKNATF